jgi:hypothetical protein
MEYSVEIPTCVLKNIPSFIKFLLRNVRRCNVGITDGRNL